LDGLVRSAVTGALDARLARRALPLAAALVENEQRRLEALLLALLQQDLARAAAAEFTVSQLEMTQEGELGGVPIRVRMDRLDRLDDGRLIILDYKSGAPQSFRPLDERPRQAQLLAYALLAPAPPAGIAAVHLRAGEIRWCGVAADPALMPALSRTRAPSAPWPELLAHWRRVIDTLTGEFAAGLATVQPLAGACKECHLPGLCRIPAARQPPPDPEIEGTPVDDL
jgi:RecB family exonuclease